MQKDRAKVHFEKLVENKVEMKKVLSIGGYIPADCEELCPSAYGKPGGCCNGYGELTFMVN